jgi:tight adherence protein B
MQGIIVGAMPLALALVLLLLSPDTMVPFLQSAAGVLLITLGIFMEILGAYFIRRIVSIDV